MGMFLNSTMPFEAYQRIVSGRYFVDKSELLNELNDIIGMEERFYCITRPRRFGKTVMANMVASYYGKAEDSSGLFDQLEIAQSETYRKHLNQHQVIYIDFSDVPRECMDYNAYIDRIHDGLLSDLTEAYPQITINREDALWDVMTKVSMKSGDKFIFVMDEWDAVFHMSFLTETDRKEYLLFLKSMLKSKQYVDFAYMTGVLPIAKYSSGSELNMFLEYDMSTSIRFCDYFGFLDEEVDRLYEIYVKTNKRAAFLREDLRIWYDGYHNAMGNRMYNPRSIVCALIDNQIRNFWTNSGPYDEVFYYVRNNIEAVRDDLVLMLAGEGVEANVQDYAAVSMNIGSRDEIYSAMVVYGLLTYDDGKVYIPNRELMDQFRKLVMTKDSLGYVYRLAKESEKMLKATLDGDTRQWRIY